MFVLKVQPLNLLAQFLNINMHFKTLETVVGHTMIQVCACFSERPYQLYGYHEDGLEGKVAVTEVKQVL